MNRNRIGVLLIMVVAAWCSAGSLTAFERNADKSPWLEALYATDGHLISAAGVEKSGARLELMTETRIQGSRSALATTYRRGSDTLQIEKIFDGGNAMDVVFTAREERLVVSLTLDDLTGETLVVYRMPDGEVFSLWISGDGQLLNGDLNGLRRALTRPMSITRLMRSYVSNKKTLESSLPSAAEGLIMYRQDCGDSCAVGCSFQCALECSMFGPAGCQICHTACATGCLIGCWG